MRQATTREPAPAQAPQAPKTTTGGTETTIQTTPDGKVIIRSSDGPVLAPTAEGVAVPPPAIPYDPNAGPPESVVVMTVVLIVAVAAVIIGLPIVRAFARRMDRSHSQPERAGADPESAQRLARMEQAIDSIAIEVERISEGQRFTTKLLSEAPKGVEAERRIGQG